MKKLFSKLMFMGLAALTFTACEDVPEPYDMPGTGQNIPGTSTEIEGGTGDGTIDTPFNAIAALNYGNTLASGEESPGYCYVKGIVVSIKEEFTTNFGNGTFYISEDGKAGNQFYAYRVLYLGNKKFTANDTQIKVGDEVVVCGIITNYNGTIETAQNKGFLYSLNGENRGGEPQQGVASKPVGDGTLANPYNAAAAIELAQKVGEAESDDVYIKGKVASITEQYGTQYGNATFTISDDGTTASTTFTVYRALYLGNKKYTSGDLLKEGDDVIIYGKVTNFKGNTPETAQGKAYLYSLNGNTGGGETPQPGGEAKGSGTLEDPYNYVAAIKYAQEVGDAESPKDVYIKGKVASITEQYGTQFGNATFTITDDGKAASETFTVYRALYLGNQKYASGDLLKEGDDVIICGKVTCFKGNTPETVQGKAYLYSLNGKTEGSGETPQPQPGGEATGDGTLENPYNAVAANAVASALASGAETSTDVYVKGKVVDVKEQYGTQFGNATFYISDDGTANGQFYVFRALYLGNVKYTAGDQLKKGDDVIICGRLTNYMGNTPETAQNKAYLYSLNGKTESSGETPTPGPGDETGDGFVITMSSFGLDNQADANTLTASDGTTLTFSQEGGKNAPKYYTAAGGSVRMYALNSLTINSSKTITKVVITTTEPYQGTTYNGNDQMYGEAGGNKVMTSKDSDTQVTFSNFSSNTLKIVNDFTGNSGGTQLRVAKITITYAK